MLTTGCNCTIPYASQSNPHKTTNVLRLLATITKDCVQPSGVTAIMNFFTRKTYHI